MSSGDRRILIQNLEQADPSDIVRAQAFAAKARAESLRWLRPPRVQGNFYGFPGLIEPHQDVPSDEVAHQCLSGLLVRPDNATFLHVDPGAAAIVQPARAGLTADDSFYIFVDDPGIQDTTTLTFLANGGPGVRWDIVECQASADTVTETPLRPFFNPTSEVFVPTNVSKVQRATLTYRIRRGTQGAGVPAIDPDWMPLAAVHVRADSTSFLDSDVYDIRPLETDRCPWSPSHPQVAPGTTNGVGYRLEMYEAEFSPVSGIAGINGRTLRGYFRSHFGGFWSGGVIRRNTPAANVGEFGVTTADGPAADHFNPQASGNRSSAYVGGADTSFTIGAFFPRGYPRWVRYSQAALVGGTSNRLRKSGRLPQGPRGILMVGESLGRGDGIILPQSLPTVFGDATGAWGHVVGEGFTDGAAEYHVPQGGADDRRFQLALYDVTLANGATSSARTLASAAWNLAGALWTITHEATISSFDLTLPKDYAPIPPYARAVQLEVNLLVTFGSAAVVNAVGAFLTLGGAGVAAPATVIPWPFGGSNPTAPGDVWNWTGSFWVPLFTSPNGFDDHNLNSTISRLAFLIGHSVATTGSTATARVVGYQL